jgi:hypothetical protein
MLFLDFLIFGNGHGLASPYFDDRFYWLSGRLYTWIGGFGAQLSSRQWRHPLPGETRKIRGLTFRPFSSRRQFLWLFRHTPWAIPTPIARVAVSWATELPADLDEANAFLRDFQRNLGDHM